MVKKYLPWIGVALIASWIAIDTIRLVAATWDFTTDDAYITLRYSDNLAHGEGITWNPGEDPPVEGYSNFSYVVIGAAVIVVGGDPVIVLKVMGVLALVGTCAMLYLLARCWLGPLASILPALLLTRYLGTVYWAASGLETPVYQFLVVASVAVFARALRGSIPERGGLVRAGLLACAASLTRPEGPLVAIALILVLAIHVARLQLTWSERAKYVLAFALAFGVPYSIYFGWRLVHFERLLPNSVYCKSMFGGESMQLVDAYRALAWPYVAASIAHDWRKPDMRLLALLAVALAYGVVLRGVDPIIGTYNRHALAPWALLLVPAVAGIANIVRWVRVPEIAREWIVAGLVASWALLHVPHGSTEMLSAHAADYAARGADREDVGRWLRTHLGPRDAYVIGDCGVIPYVGGAIAIDAYCLNNGEMTRPPIAGSRAKLIDRIFELAPGYIVVHSGSRDELRPRVEYGFYNTLVADARFAGYEHVTTIGGRQSEFAYWIYRRR